MNALRLNLIWLRVMIIGGVFAASGCTTTSKRVVYKTDGVVISHAVETDYALKMSGHGGYVLVTNSATVYGKEYPVLAGHEPCVFLVPERNLVFFVCGVPPAGTGLFLERELHIVDTKTRSDTAVPLGRSEMGDDLGGHPAGSPYAERVEFESDQILRITTYDGRTVFPPKIPPSTRSVFVVDLVGKKLLSQQHSPVKVEISGDESRPQDAVK
jgi:hypothetical protein